MIINPIVPVWIMVPICIFLLLLKRRGIFPFIRQIVIVSLLFAISLRVMIPGEGGEKIEKERDLQVVFVIDKTISMIANDHNGKTRLEGVNEDCAYIIDQLDGSQFSVIGFDNSAQIMSPYTSDVDHVKATIESIYPMSSMYAEGTNVGIGKDCLLNYLKNREKKGKTIVFFISDGENNSKESIASFEEVKEYVDGGAVLGYGTTAGGTMDLITGYDRTTVETIMDDSEWPSVPAVSKIDESNLKKIADELGVGYVHMERTTDVNQALAEAKKMDSGLNITSEQDEKRDRTDGATDLYYLFVIPLLGMLLLEVILFARKKGN